MCRMFSLVLEWDATDFRKVVENIRLNQERISNEHLRAIDRHLAACQDQREFIRKKSIQEQRSIVATILEAENQQLLESLTDRQHTSCLEYYAAQLAIRDREHIIDILCSSNPDLTTGIVLEGLGALAPMIQEVHKNVDLRKHLSAIEGFLSDFIKTTKPRSQDSNPRLNPPAVKDFVRLLQRNRHLLWAYLHDFCIGCPNLRDTWRGWMKEYVLRNFLFPLEALLTYLLC
jgi:parvulin-like peptidyl-prolyl isomerase